MDNDLPENDKQSNKLINELVRLNKTHLIEEAEKVRINAIMLKETETTDDEISVGATKIGGYPDLPPDFTYPALPSFTRDIREKQFTSEKHFRFVKTGEEIIPETSMRLMAQINLSEAAPYDRDGLLPKTGMLYFFWGGKFGQTETYDKVIYYNGNADLTRTAPPLPYYIGEVFDEKPLPVKKCSFEAAYEYNLPGDGKARGWDREFEELDEFLDSADFKLYGTRLFGIPYGGNIETPPKGWLNLLWLGCHQGCLWNIYWRIKKDDLAKNDFDNVSLGADCD